MIKRIIALLLAIALVFLAYQWLDRLTQAHTRSPRRSCANNLKQLGLAVIMWRGDHTNALPRNWSKMARYIGHHSNLLVCPDSGHEPGDIATATQWSDYRLVTNPAPLAEDEAVLAYCSPTNHDDKGASVVFLDGHVEWLNVDECRTVLQKQNLTMR